MYFYLTLDTDDNVSFSPLPERDKLGSNVKSYLSLPLDYLTVQSVLKHLQRQRFTKTLAKRFRLKSQNLQEEIRKILVSLGRKELFTWQNPGFSLAVDQTQQSRKQEAFDQLVSGRQLSSSDLRRLARELKLNDTESLYLAHRNVEQGNAQWVPAVRPQGKGWQCQRCGEKNVEEWPSLHGSAATCQSCEGIGPCTSLEVLYRDLRPLFQDCEESSFRPQQVLTTAQRLASDQVLEFVKDPFAEKILLWAACGAGKTEVCFPAAAWALKEGKSVLFAAPRQDVIHDVSPRLERDFPGVSVQVLTGTVPVKFQKGRMVLATTHQVLRFWRAFDVIFLDEMDAFPYYGSQALQWGLGNALRQGGKMVYLTATPSPEGLKQIREGKMHLISLPARHHRNPLPVPTWERSSDLLRSGGCTAKGITQIESLRRQGPVLVFVPKISWLDPWIKCLQRQFPRWRIDGSYSADPRRRIKLEQLKQGGFDLFVSTTILERGITLPKIQVVVIGADHPIFDERALVQMAGRVGRTQENPQGRVLFIAKQKTASIKTAIQWIDEQNEQAWKLGLLGT